MLCSLANRRESVSGAGPEDPGRGSTCRRQPAPHLLGRSWEPPPLEVCSLSCGKLAHPGAQPPPRALPSTGHAGSNSSEVLGLTVSLPAPWGQQPPPGAGALCSVTHSFSRACFFPEPRHPLPALSPDSLCPSGELAAHGPSLLPPLHSLLPLWEVLCRFHKRCLRWACVQTGRPRPHVLLVASGNGVHFWERPFEAPR